MSALLWTILIASLVGSLHCAGMCGAFLAFAVFQHGDGRVSRVRLQCAYHGGRLLTYTSLGFVAGLLGAGVDAGGAWIGIQRIAAILAGVTILVFGVGLLIRLLGLSKENARVRVPKVFQHTLERGMRFAMTLPPTMRALSVGMLTTLLPCGWLYAFVAIAAGTAHPVLGAMSMAVFWVGTVPILVAIGTGIQQLTGRFGRAIPFISAVSIIVVATLTLFGRFELMSRKLLPAELRPVNSVSELVEEVRDTADEPAPCCHDDH